ncbi:hypothetical protein [Parafilimonas sp.]|uniref:hypothetical protein n=1 Tax=Parafilimonas sp. TaxID=1969739 RepID=UPI0039E36588
MKPLALILFALIFIQPHNTSETVLAKMHAKYAGKWMKSFSFTQTTETYFNDSLIKTATWYEHIVYPDKFRIDFGDKTSGNAAIFTPDSVYSFRGGKLQNTFSNDDDLTFILGGMYFHPLDSVKAIFGRLGYNLGKFHENDSVYVIGADSTNEAANQFWVDRHKLVVVKFLNYSHGEKEEGIFYNHKQFGNSWSETACDFYINDALVQKEIYRNCKANAVIDLKIFNPHKFVQVQ